MNDNGVIRVVLADDQTMIRQGLRYIIDQQPDMEVVAEVVDGEEAVREVLRVDPDVVLMDIQMPKKTGIEATETIVQARPGTKILLLTTFDVQEYVFDGIRAGAVGYLLKDLDTNELLHGIRMAAQGAAIYRSSTASQALAQAVSPPFAGPKSGTADDVAQVALLDPLTQREIDVLQQMAYGKRNSDIAAALRVSEGTVKTHVHRILQKLGVEDRTQAVVLAIRQRIVQ